MNECRWTRNRAASSSGGCTEHGRNVRSRPVPFCVLHCSVGWERGAAEKQASSGNIDPPADGPPRCCRRAMSANPKLLPVTVVPAVLSLPPSMRYMTPAGTSMQKVSGCFCPSEPAVRTGQEARGRCMDWRLAAGNHPFSPASSVSLLSHLRSSPRRPASSPSRCKKPEGLSYAMPTFPNTFQPRRSNPTAPSSQPLPVRPVRAPGGTSGPWRLFPVTDVVKQPSAEQQAV